MDLTPLYIVLGAAAGGFVQGLSGFAFGLVASAVWAWVVVPQLAGPMVVFGSLLGQILSIAAVRRAFDLGRVLPFVVAGLLGIPIGVVLLKNLDQTVFRLVVDLILLVYASTMLFFRHLGPVKGGMIEELGVKIDPRGNVATDDNYMSSVNGIFAAGDLRRGQSLVVWAITEGRKAARAMDVYLMGDSKLG